MAIGARWTEKAGGSDRPEPARGGGGIVSAQACDVGIKKIARVTLKELPGNGIGGYAEFVAA